MFYNLVMHQLISIKMIILVISSPIKVLEKGILPLETNSIAIQFFLDLENDDKLESCNLYIKPNKCCLYDTDEVDCDSMKLLGRYDDMLKPKDRKIYLFFYVTMFQMNHEGYCHFDLIHRCGMTGSKCEEIRIAFDTRLHKKQTHYLLRNFKRERIVKCKSIDEDCLNNCRPVNCDLKYAGTKPFFNKDKRRCIEAVECVADPFKSLPDVVYEPASNTCKNLDHSLSVTDIYAINSGLAIIITPNDSVTNNEDASLIIYKPNCTTISQNVLFLKDLISGKLNSVKGYSVDFKESSYDALISIFSKIFGISVILVLFVCFSNAGLIIYKEWKARYSCIKEDDEKNNIKTNDPNDYEECCGVNKERVNKEITNKLLKEVIVSELPLELRGSVVDICERIGKEVRWKRRYRMIDDGSDINLKPVASSDTSTTTDIDISEKARILK